MSLDKKQFINYLLLPLSVLFFVLSVLRRYLYHVGVFKMYRFKKPVIVVGNITVGGSGKTPIVMALCQYFKQQGKKVGVVSRGYAGTHQQGNLLVTADTLASDAGDEPVLIATQTQLPVMVNKNRVKAVQALIEQHNVDIVISDDGLQHYAMGRDIEIAVVDGNRRFGNGFFLPAGPLREPKSRLKSVDFVINNGALHAGEITAELTPKAFINMVTQVQKPLDFFTHQNCYGVAGIGHPQRFFNTLTKLGIQLEPHGFADHHAFTQEDLAFEQEHPIIMSAKDCVKCEAFATQQMWYLHVEATLSDDFFTRLDNKL